MAAPAQPFSVLVTSDAWRAEVDAWIHDRVEEGGRRLTGPLDQRRVRPWSTQIVVPTDAGPLWFKANCPPMAFEPALHDLLAMLVPGDVDRPFATDVDRGWMMTTDRGTTLGESHEPTLEDWQAVVTTTAHLQRVAADHRDEVLATGVLDCSPATVEGRFEWLVDVFASLPDEHPSHADADLVRQLRSALPRVVDAAAVLAEAPVPSTVQHGDIHTANVFAVGDTVRVFDFGDVQWASAVEVLSVPYGVITQEGRLPWEPVRDAYVERWADVADARTMHALWEATAFTQPVNRAQTWWDPFATATDEELVELGGYPLQHLTRVLDA
jgi:hypothetical protein